MSNTIPRITQQANGCIVLMGESYADAISLSNAQRSVLVVLAAAERYNASAERRGEHQHRVRCGRKTSCDYPWGMRAQSSTADALERRFFVATSYSLESDRTHVRLTDSGRAVAAAFESDIAEAERAMHEAVRDLHALQGAEKGSNP